MAPAAAAALCLLCLTGNLFAGAHGFGIIQVHRTADAKNMSMSQLIARDRARQERMLASFDFKMGGIGGSFKDSGIYYALVNVGTPPKTFRVQVDSGSNMLWFNCAGCKQCPKRSGLGFTSSFYDQKESSTSKKVTCDHELCPIINKGDDEFKETCETPDTSCPFSTTYADGSSVMGNLIQDELQYVTAVSAGSSATKQESVPVVFGCGVEISGSLTYEDYAVDGLIGFGRSNESFISQIAKQGKAKKIFSHCLDNRNGGGGIFAIGDVVYPELKRTKMLDQFPGYRVSLKSMDVGGKPLDLPAKTFVDGPYTGAALDSGGTLSNIPKLAYDLVIDEIQKAAKTSLKSAQGAICYPKDYKPDIDKVLPNITFNLAGGLSIHLTPADYVTAVSADITAPRCVTILPSDETFKETKDMFLFGAVVLTNKVVLYDLEKNEIGFSDFYNCSSFVKIKDDKTGETFRLNAQGLPSAAGKIEGRMAALMAAFSAIVYVLASI